MKIEDVEKKYSTELGSRWLNSPIDSVSSNVRVAGYTHHAAVQLANETWLLHQDDSFFAPPTVNPWTRVWLATAGFSTAQEWYDEYGIWRDYKSIVIHDMEGYLPAAISTWNQGSASAHLAVCRNGEIVLTVPLEDVAWHAGTNAEIGRTSFWKTTNINPHSFGVEMEGFSGQPYTPAQATSIHKIALWAEAKYSIPRVHTFDQISGWHAHSELSNQRSDPGPTFDWDWVIG